MSKRSASRSFPRINRWFRGFNYEKLEPKRLLASVIPGYSPSPILDAFAPDAVTYKDMVGRAAIQPYMKDELIVAIRTPTSLAQAGLAGIDWTAMTGDPGVVVQRNLMTVARGNQQNVTLVHLKLTAGTDLFSVMRSLDSRSEVMWSAPNFYQPGESREFTPNDPQYASQYHHPLMQNNLAWDTTLGSANIIIAVTDDGVQLNHPDLMTGVWQNDDFPFDGEDNDFNGYIDDYNGWDFSSNNNDPNPNGSGDTHGTHVAGIAAGRTNNGTGIAGVAGAATIMPLQFYGVGAWTSAVINATFTYAANNGAKIVNTSYNIDGWVGEPTFTAGLQYLHDNGVLHLNSAGNNSQLNPPRQAFEQTLLVASTESNDTKSSFSNYGVGVDVSAPGGNILSTLLGSTYGELSGTSMATPNAAGVAGLIWSAHPTWTRDQVAAQLVATADNIDAQNPSFVGLLGGGRVNAFRGLHETLAAPQIRLVNGLPANGGFVDDLTIDSFDLAFDQILDPASANNMANYELRRAGLDDMFGTADDQVYTLSGDPYQIGTNLFTLDIGEGTLPYGHYRLTVLSGGLQNPFGTSLDGDGNGTGGDAYVSEFHISPPPNGSVAFHRASYRLNDTVQIMVSDSNAVAPISVVVTSSGGDSETIQLVDNGNGSFTASINTTGGSASSNSGFLEVSLGHQLTVTYHDDDNGLGGSGDVTDTAVISNVIQYDSTDTPVAIADNATVTSTISIGDTGVIADLDLRLDITHTWDSDLDVFLIAPDGTRIELFQDIGGSGDNFTQTYLDDEAATLISAGIAPFTGNFRPVGSFATLDTDSITGDWTLEITDDAGADVGFLNEWSLFVDVRSIDQGILNLDRSSYAVADTMLVSVFDGNHTGPMSVSISTSGGDSETLLLTNSGPGLYTGSINTAAGSPGGNNGQLDVAAGHIISVSYLDQDDGSGNSNTVTKTARVSNVIEYPSSNVPVDIVDLTTVTSTIDISDEGTIADLDLRLNITHTWDSDLDVFLIAPDGTRIELFQDVGGSGDNFDNTYLDDEAATPILNGAAPFAGPFKPAGSFANLDGMDITGTWTLEITDDAGADEGSLNSWSLFIDVIPVVVVPDISVSGPGTVSETDSGTQQVTFTVMLSVASNQIVTVDYATTNAGYVQAAKPGLDYTSGSGTLTFNPGETSQTVTIDINNDVLVELDEEFGLEISNAVNGSIVAGTADVMILDNDPWSYPSGVDFGHELSPLGGGLVAVSDLPYTPGKGLGWTTGTSSMQFVDRGIGTATNRDLVLLPSGSFAFDLPNGTYMVRVNYGDATTAHELMRVAIEGVNKAPVSTAINQFITRAYSVNLTDGQLNLDFLDLGGADPNVAITSIAFGRRTSGDFLPPGQLQGGKGEPGKPAELSGPWSGRIRPTGPETLVAPPSRRTGSTQGNGPELWSAVNQRPEPSQLRRANEDRVPVALLLEEIGDFGL